jgi:hypothetical protein
MPPGQPLPGEEAERFYIRMAWLVLGTGGH